MALGDVIARLSVSLALETVAFEKGADKSEKRMNQMRRKFESTAKQFAVGAAAIGAAVGATVAVFRDMAHQAIDSAKQIEDLSNVANASTDQFQKAAFAARSVGIESEKLADIYKDVNDKIGDFVATGGGAMADFFENVAPKVGVTAESFRNLSGPDALQLYVSSLEKANLNQQDMTFYMEAIASDATMLLPLLRNNGQAMGEFASEAERLGLVMSGEEIAKAKEVANNLALLNAQVDARQNKKMLEHADSILAYEEGISSLKLALIDAVVQVQEIGKSLDFLTQLTHQKLVTMRKAVESFASGTAEFFDALPGKVIAHMQRLYNGVKMWLQDKLGGVFDSVTKKVKAVERGFFWLLDEVVLNSHIPDMVDLIGEHMGRLQALMVDPATKATEETEGRFAKLSDRVQTIMDRLFPQFAKLREYYADIAALDADVKAGKLSEGEAAVVRREIGYEYRGGRAEPTNATIAGPTVDMGKSVEKAIDGISTKIGGLADKTKIQTVRIADSFADMAEQTLRSFSSLTSAIKGGGFLDILESAVGLFLNLGQSGAFGSGLAGKLGGIPGYAGGTNNHPGGLALVGERGPELVSMPRGSQVFTNRESAGMMSGRGELAIRLGPGLEAEWLRKSANQTVQIIEVAAPGMLSAASAKTRLDAARPITPGGATG